MRTTPFGVLFESLKIDKLRKRWVARCLFLLVYFVNASVLVFEPGSSDFSGLMAWQEKVASLPATATVLPPLPTDLYANLLYIASLFALVFFDMLIAPLYTRIFLGDFADQSVGDSIRSYVKRLPFLFVFVLVFWMASLFTTTLLNLVDFTRGFSNFVIILILMLFFFVPNYLVFEKKGFIDAFTQNALRTKGLKPFIFVSMIALNALYSLPKFLLVLFLWEYKEASALLDAFFITFLCLSFGRMSGVIYRLVHMKSEKNESSQNSIENP